MRAAGSSGRGVGAGLPGAPGRVRRSVVAAAVAGALMVGTAPAGPAAALAPPPRYPAAVAMGGGSEYIAELVRRVRAILALLESTQASIDTLSEQRDQVAAELESALERRRRLNGEVKALKKSLKAAVADEAEARASYRTAKKARKSAKRELAASQEAHVSAQEDYATVAAVADEASDALRRAERRVTKAKRATARTRAFTAWQMAAVDDRAAHARQMLAADRATDEFVGVQAAEAAMTRAQYARDEAAETKARAIARAAVAQEEFDTRKAKRSRARAAVRGLRAEAEALAKDLKAAKKARKKLSKRLDTIQRFVVEAQQNLAGGRARDSGVLP